MTDSSRHEAVYDFILRYSAAHGGNSPSAQDIADEFTISKQAAYLHQRRLIEEGRAVREDGKFWLTGIERPCDKNRAIQLRLPGI